MSLVPALALSVLLSAWSGPAKLRAALALETEGRDKQAITALEKIAVEEVEWSIPRMEAARLYLKLGTDLPKARAHLESALKLSPENPRAHYLFGLIREEEGAETDAIESLEQAARLRPDYFEARFRLGGLHATRGDWLKAEYHYRAIARAQPESTTARLQLAVALEKQERLEDSERELRKLWDDQPDSVVIQRKLMDFYERTGRPKLAERVGAETTVKKRKLRTLKPSRR